MITRQEIVAVLGKGSGAAAAKLLGISRQAIQEWKSSPKPVPAERVLAIEAATGHRVSRHDLRPDIYPREPWCRCPACERERQQQEQEEDAA